jgi:hypothetical protein
MPTAFNEKTGELLVLGDDGGWTKPTTAKNPQTGETLYHDGAEWKPIPITAEQRYVGQTAAIADMGLGIGDEFLAGVGSVFDPASGDYSKQLAYIREAQKKYGESDMGGQLARTVIGSLPLALATGSGVSNAVGRALPTLGRVGNAVVTGGIYGGAAGFGSGEGGVTNRAANAAVGAGTGAAIGGAVEGVVSPVVSRFIQYVRGNPTLIDTSTGTLTQRGEDVARRAGLNPDEASAALNREFATEAQRAANPAEAAAVAEARTLPSPVILTQGQVSLSPEQQMFEDLAAKGSYGSTASGTMRNAFDAQQGALRGNVEAIQQRIGGGQVAETGQGVQAVRDHILNAYQATRARVGQLYQAARDANGNAFVLGSNVGEGLAGVQGALNEAGLTARTAGRVHSILTDAARNLRDTGRAVGDNPNISVGNLFSIRSELAALQGSSDTVEAAAAGQAKRGIDAWLNRAIDEDLIAGDPSVVELWRRAISSRREMATRFQAGDFVEKLVARRPGGGNDLKLDPLGAVNLIFGSSKTGFVTKSGMVDGLSSLQRELQDNPQAWNALREEAFLRFARTGEGANGPLGQTFSGGNFAKAWETALRDSPEVMRTMFTNEERNLISQFARVARRATVNVKGGANTSNTSVGIAQMAKKLWASTFMGPRLAGFLEGLPFLQGLGNIGNDIRASAAAAGRVRTGPPPLQPLSEMVGPRAAQYLPAATPLAAMTAGNRPTR